MQLLRKSLSTFVSVLAIAGCHVQPHATLGVSSTTATKSTNVNANPTTSRNSEDARLLPPFRGSGAGYTGPIKVVVDPSINQHGGSKASVNRYVLSVEQNHNSNDAHAQEDKGQYFNPNDPAALSGVDASYGDTPVVGDTPEESFVVSTAQFGTDSAPLQIIGGELLVRPKIGGEEMLSKLREKYSFEVLSSPDEYLTSYALRFNLEKVSLAELSQNLMELNQLTEASVQEVTFSSINNAKLMTVLTDLLLNYEDSVDFAQLNILENESTHGWHDQVTELPLVVDNRGYRNDQYGDWWFKKLNIAPDGVGHDAWNYSIGTDVKVAVIDSGFDVLFHPELRRIISNSTVISPETGRVVAGSVNAPRPNATTEAQKYHGSSVSLGLAGERNNGIGTAGVAPNVKLWPIRTMGERGQAAAIRYAVANGVRIINISSGINRPPLILWLFRRETELDIAVKDVLKKDVSVNIVVAAGNTDRNIETINNVGQILQNRKDVIVVGAIEYNPDTDSLKKWTAPKAGGEGGSTFGDNVDIWAPGRFVETANFRAGLAAIKTQQIANDGTSISAPIVAGTLALMASARGGIPLSRDEAVGVLRDSAIPASVGTWTNGTRGGVPGVGGYILRNNQNMLPMVNVGEAVYNTPGINLNRTPQAKIGLLTSSSGSFVLEQDGIITRLSDSVPLGTYSQFLGRYTRVSGWTKYNDPKNEFDIVTIEKSNREVTGAVEDTFGNRVTGLGLALVNRSTGLQVGTTTTDNFGYYSFFVDAPGQYDIKVLGTSYVNASITINVTGSLAIPFVKDIIVSTPLAGDTTRFVLSWTATPADLDAHFTGPQVGGGRFHIYYANRSYLDSKTKVTLDNDVTNGYGPETITMTLTGTLPDTYRYIVHDYSNRSNTSSTALSNSDAVVYVYKGNALVRVISPRRGQTGVYWDVLRIDGVTGQLIVNNVFQPFSYVIQSVGQMENPFGVLGIKN